jgi:DNA mismatch repair protein MutL
MNIAGFIGKPETARKTRGDQYFFVNNRYIKSAYLNHAVNAAFEGIIPKDSFPSYVLYIDLDPSQIDINVHPTKQEIKFEDEKIIYAFVQAAIKHALAQFSIAPSLDFSLNADIQGLDAVSKPFTNYQQNAAVSSNLYKTFTQKNQAHFIEPNEKSELKHWKEFFTDSSAMSKSSVVNEALFAPAPKLISNTIELTDKPLFQLHQTYIVVTIAHGFLLVHQQLAHERILYEGYSSVVHNQQTTTQKSLFPVSLELVGSDAVLLTDLLPELQAIGYQIEPFGQNSFVIQGTPADVIAGDEKHAVEMLIEQFKHFSSDVKYSKREKLIRCMAKQQSIKSGKQLDQKEMTHLITSLFACSTPNISPNGSPTYLEYKEDYLHSMFGKV